MNHEESEWFSTTMESERAKMAEKVECDECGAKLPAIYDDGKLKVDCYHSCDIQGIEAESRVLNLIKDINKSYIARGLK
jgi:hypothetical protein